MKMNAIMKNLIHQSNGFNKLLKIMENNYGLLSDQMIMNVKNDITSLVTKEDIKDLQNSNNYEIYTNDIPTKKIIYVHDPKKLNT